MKEENKLCSFLDSMQEDIGLQRKKTRLCKKLDLGECLYKWFMQNNMKEFL
jgi:hypothetical protein